MRHTSRLLLALAAIVMLSACTGNMRTYVDPQYHRAGWDSIHQAAQPVPVKVIVHFQENGKSKPSVDSGLKADVENTLRRSHVFTPVTGDTARGTITVVANNLANMDAAKDKGRHYVLSFGSSAETLQDNYVFDVAFQGSNGQAFKHRYNHRLLSTMGNARAPEGMKPTTLAAGFQQVVQDVMLNFIQDWQATQGAVSQASP